MDPLLDAEQAARYLGTGTRLVRRLIAEHRIDYIKLGRYVRLRQSTLDAFIDAGRIPASKRSPAPINRSRDEHA